MVDAGAITTLPLKLRPMMPDAPVPVIVTLPAPLETALMPLVPAVTAPVSMISMLPAVFASTPLALVPASEPGPKILIAPVVEVATIPLTDPAMPPLLAMLTVPFVVVALTPSPPLPLTLPAVTMAIEPAPLVRATMPLPPDDVMVEAGVTKTSPPADLALMPVPPETTGPVPTTSTVLAPVD